ncbi:MAG: O-antigen ligase family protein, partial [Christensenellaceae bacterium]|nr:O-antigen ligase family protein [Christensenellaceae bacterium]
MNRKGICAWPAGWAKKDGDEKRVLLLTAANFLPIYGAVAALACMALWLLISKKAVPMVTSVKGGRLMLLAAGLSVAVSAIRGNLMGCAIGCGMAALFLVGMYLRRVMTRRLFEKAAALCCHMSLICFAVAVVEVAVMGGDHRAVSTFHNANYYAAAAETVALLSLYKMLRKKGTRRAYYGGVCAANMAALALTGCRTGILVLLAALPVMLLLLGHRKALRWYLLLGGGCVAAFLLLPGLFPRAEELLEDFGKRYSIWKTAVLGIRSAPVFGLGGDGYSLIHQALGGHPAPHAHNILLDGVLNFGFVGVALMVPGALALLHRAGEVYARRNDRPRMALLFSVLTAVFIHGMTDITAFWPQTGFLVLLCLAGVGIYEPRSACQEQTVWVEAPIRKAAFKGCTTLLGMRICRVSLRLKWASVEVEDPRMWKLLAATR